MTTLDKEEFALHLPESPGDLDQDQEWIEVEIGDERRRIRLHDYAAIYSVPGLYEQLFSDRLTATRRASSAACWASSSTRPASMRHG